MGATRGRPVLGRWFVTVVAAFALLVVVTLAAAEDLVAEPGDRIGGTLETQGEVEPVVMDLPAGAAVTVTLQRSGGSSGGGLHPVLVVRDPDGTDRSSDFGLRTVRRGARVLGRARSLRESGTWRFEVSGADDTVGSWALTLTAKAVRDAHETFTLGADAEGSLAFDVFAGSALAVTLRAPGGEPTLEAIDVPGGEPIDLAGATARLRGERLTVTGVVSAATGAHTLRAGLADGAAGRLAAAVRITPPKPRRARLTHPGGSVPAPGLVVGPATLPAGTRDVAYLAMLTATGGTAPYSFDVSAGALPPDVSLAADGVLSGTPSAEGTYGFTVRVTDSGAPAVQVTRIYSMLVRDSAGTPEWSLLSATGTAPAGRSSPGFVYDPVNGRMIVALGSTGNSGFPPVRSDTAALSLGASPAWTTLGTGPSARWGHSLVVDSTRRRAILYGGNVNGFQTNGEVWALDLSTPTGSWTQLSPGGTAPAARLSHAAVYDSANDRMVVFGGGAGTTPGLASRNDLWELSFAGSANGTWTVRTPSSTSPAAREFAAAVYAPANRRMVVHGGMTSGQQFAETWVLDLTTPGQETWALLEPGGDVPTARDEHTAVLDSARGRVVIFGGRVGSSDTNEAFALDLTPAAETWTRLVPTGTPPAARDSHAAVYDPAGGRMLVFSGFQGFPSTPFTDVWELRLP